LSNLVNVKFNYCEYQLIFQLEETLSSLEQKIINSGAKRVGEISQEEEFWISAEEDLKNPSQMLRIRNEEGNLSYLSVIKNKKSEETELFYQLTQNTLMKNSQVEESLKNCKRVAKFHKNRIVFLKDTIQVNLERISIPQLGSFINFTFSSEEDFSTVQDLISSLDINIKTVLQYGYYEYIVERMGFLKKFYHFFYDFLGNTAFGISAAVLSILGLMIGVYAALSTKVAIITSIISLALADSLADTYALYSQKKMRGASTLKALKFGFSNFFSRFLLTSSFILPILFLDKILGIVINLIFGFTILIILNLLISIYQESNKIKSLLKSLTFSVIVLFSSYFAGTLINMLF